MKHASWATVAVAAALLVQAVPAQVTTATIYGTVLDPAGAPVPNAAIKVLNPQTGQERATLSAHEGQFTLTFLPIGTYSLTVEARGFKTEQRSDVTVAAGQKIDIAISLQVGCNYTTTLQYLNPAAFARIPLVPASGATARYGNIGRNAFWAPGAWTLDLALSKTLELTERMRLQIRADAFNALNHTNLGGVATDINSANFGRLTRADARVVQFNARLTF